jgi:hypothetical protein
MTNLEAKQALARKLDINYANIANNGLFSDADLQDWIQSGVTKAWDYKPWDFTEGAKTGTTINTAYYDYPQDVQAGTASVLLVDGGEYDKKDFRDYQRHLKDNPSSTEKIWAEYKGFIFINKNSYTVGVPYDVFGKLNAPYLTLDSDLLPFSPISDNQEYSGNRAIIHFAYGEALGSEKMNNPSQSLLEEKKAYAILDILWKPFADARASAQSKDRPFFDIPNFYGSNGFTPGNFNR